MRFSVAFGVLAICPIMTCVGQTNATSGQSINLIAAQRGNPVGVATATGGGSDQGRGPFRGIIGPRNGFGGIINDRRGLGFGQQGFGTTIGQQGTTSIEPAMIPAFGLVNEQGRALSFGPQGFQTSIAGQNAAFVPPQGFVPGFRHGGVIGPQSSSTAIGSQIIALAINAQNSSISIGPQGVVNTPPGQSLNSTGQAQPQTRIFTVPGIPHTAFAGRVTSAGRGH